MTLALIFVTTDPKFKDYVNLKKAQIVPAAWRGAGSQVLLVRAFCFEGVGDSAKLESFLTGVVSSADKIILFVDSTLISMDPTLAECFFTRHFERDTNGKTLHNYFGMIIPPALKAFNVYSARFSNKAERDIFLLPLDNFKAVEVRLFKQTFENKAIVAGELAEALEDFLKKMRSRRKPKTYSRSKNNYLVDDNTRYFELGHEDHARFDTAVPPHTGRCAFKGSFRFGAKIAEGLHYNVSEETGCISGYFTNCHGRTLQVKSQTHLNMFSNGFW